MTSLKEPDVIEVSLSDFPIMFVNVSGNYDGLKLKSYAKKLQDRFEELPEVNKAEIAGAPESEIQVNCRQIQDGSRRDHVSMILPMPLAMKTGTSAREISGSATCSPRSRSRGNLFRLMTCTGLL